MVYLLSFFSGMLAKFVDVYEEHKKKRGKLTLASGIAAGALIAFILIENTELYPLVIGTALSLVLAGKIDTWGHGMATATIFFAILISGAKGINIYATLLFLLASFADERFNDRFGDGEKYNITSLFAEARPFLEISAFFYSFFTGIFTVWLALFSFDTGYIFVKICDKFFRW